MNKIAYYFHSHIYVRKRVMRLFPAPFSTTTYFPVTNLFPIKNNNLFNGYLIG